MRSIQVVELAEVGRVIRFHRTHAGLTRERLAEFSGVSAPTIYRVETGAASARLDTVAALLDALNVSVGFQSPLMDVYSDDESSGDDA